MIALLTGEVRSLSANRVVLDVNGVGYLVHITAGVSERISLGTRISLHTTMIVREDSQTLYGFLDESTRNLFESVQTVSGVGPKVALSLVSALSVDDLARAIADEDVGAIESVPGIGRKGAQRLILELKGKLSDLGTTTRRRGSVPAWREQLLAALTSLGFTAKESDQAIDRYLATIDDPTSLAISELLKGVLAHGRRR